jgi:hypothetical protein
MIATWSVKDMDFFCLMVCMKFIAAFLYGISLEL